jgi:predicted aldo/keto reductase-like oxidoreductase
MSIASSGQRLRTCRACGKKFEYPVKGKDATRHHCDDCVSVPPETRKILERLNSRLTQLERQMEGQSRRAQTSAPQPAA